MVEPKSFECKQDGVLVDSTTVVKTGHDIDDIGGDFYFAAEEPCSFVMCSNNTKDDDDDDNKVNISLTHSECDNNHDLEDVELQGL